MKKTIRFNRKTMKFVGITEQVKTQLKETYPRIDIDKELNKMSLWLSGPKGLTREGNIGFIMNWLQRVTPSQALTTTEQLNLLVTDSPLANVLKEYLEDLWKNQEHLFSLNTIKR